jgi:hypothetical protein
MLIIRKYFYNKKFFKFYNPLICFSFQLRNDYVSLQIKMGFEVMLPSACSFIVDVSLSYILVVAVLHYMFRPTWPFSSV